MKSAGDVHRFSKLESKGYERNFHPVHRVRRRQVS